MNQSDKNTYWTVTKIVLGTAIIAALLILYVQTFLLSYLGGPDVIGYGFWWMQLFKKHLSVELVYPYFTPCRCGGFLLGADAQVYILSLYSLTHFLIPNVIWSTKITHFFASLILAFGVFNWLSCFGIKSKISRLFTGLIVSVSGYWVFHLTNEGGQFCVHCLAHVPWVLYYVEKMLVRPDPSSRTVTKDMFFARALFFL